MDGATDALPRPADRTLPVTERLRRLAGRRRGPRELRGRLHGYAEKAVREAGTHTSWHDPDADFESAVHGWLDALMDGPIAAELTTLVGQLDPHARSDSLGQKLVQLTAPGIPDVYQGTELWEDSLVDPDNRRPVDYRARREALKRRAPQVPGGRRRVAAAARPARYVHFRRLHPGAGRRVGRATMSWPSCVATMSWSRSAGWTVRLNEIGWGDTVLPLPAGGWTDRIGGGRFTGSVPAADLFAGLPVALLERGDG